MMAGPSALTVQRSAAMYRHFLLHRGALESMAGGVMTVDSDGRIGIFNDAAARLLGLSPAEAQWKLFAEVFVVREGLEEFTDTVLAAIHDEAVGARSTVRVRVADGTVRPLSVTTSYLVRRKDGESLKAGVVAVFDDISEIETLREAERRLMESTQIQNAELRDAYREIEEKNKALDAAARKMQVARTAAMGLIFVLFLGAAWYVWDETGAALREEIAGAPEAPSGASESAVTATVAPRRLTMTLSFVGRLVPRREVRVTSPTAGRVARVRFEYGDRVVAGEPLVELDTAEVRQRYRTARAEYLDARDGLRELENWENSLEMSRVRRAVARAGMELEARESKLVETALLLDKGIIPASEHAAAERRYDTQRLSHEAAMQDLESARTKADANALQIARLKLENAAARMQALETTLESVTISAPVSGIVLPPAAGGGGRQLGAAGGGAVGERRRVSAERRGSGGLGGRRPDRRGGRREGAARPAGSDQRRRLPRSRSGGGDRADLPAVRARRGRPGPHFRRGRDHRPSRRRAPRAAASGHVGQCRGRGPGRARGPARAAGLGAGRAGEELGARPQRGGRHGAASAGGGRRHDAERGGDRPRPRGRRRSDRLRMTEAAPS